MTPKIFFQFCKQRNWRSLKEDTNKEKWQLMEAIMLVYKLRVITVRIINGSYMLREMTNTSDNISPQC